MNLKSNFYRFWKIMSERKLRDHYTELNKKEIEYFHNYQDKKPKKQRKKEMKILQKYWGCYPFQYFRYYMYKNDCKLSIAEMKNYIPNYFAYYLFFPKFFKAYGIITDDKELSYRVLDSFKINQPALLLQYKNGLFLGKDKALLDDNTVDSIIQKADANSLFFKPTLGLGGKGIMVFNKKNDAFIDSQNNKLSAAFIKKSLGNKENYILQEGLRQHQEINQIYPGAVNTFRVYTAIEKGKAKVLFAFLRMGQGGNQLDNATQGGVVCKIDIKTGQFSPVGTSKLDKKFTKHPDTNFEFKDYTFPYWNEVRELTLSSAQKFEAVVYIGWDVAYTETGASIIEMNAGAGLQSLQDTHGGVRNAYGINDPKEFWYNNNFTLKDL
ncbi:MAG: sugar-transfer associated ATP-grasp domain-containing protein [Bacteroidota bacterium]